ncbi:AtzE family amidohydrolase [Novosphingobium terrae]|uniref:AtzE family amidohydrolase n=1 Tax=Novosphingobium terrae TaxID=2726189 RepID=UPI001F131472|nr:AtzE family amidohydrolase [Novosphingobium terrae]
MSETLTALTSASAIAGAVREGRVRAVEITLAALESIAARDKAINAVNTVLADRALDTAAAIDAAVARGEDLGPLAGVPIGLKALFDVAGHPTTAGAAMRADAAPAPRDAALLQRLTAAGAVPIAVLNMDEYAYGFVTVNAHFGTTRNPRDTARLAGGSSGGSAAAVAAGMLPLAWGSDTNGSIRVPASLCGVWGFRPAHGSVAEEGSFPFVPMLDTLGPFTNTLEDLRLAMEVAQGQPIAPMKARRVARLGGWFVDHAIPDFYKAFAGIEALLGVLPMTELPHVEAARAAAFLITAHDGGRLHRAELAKRALAFDPETRDRLLAGNLVPTPLRDRAALFGDWFRKQALTLLQRYEVLVAPATPDVAPLMADPMIHTGNGPAPARANLGMLAQPISLAGLPVLSAPLKRPGQLPLGLQLISAPGREGLLFDLAARLEAAGVLGI